MVLIYSPPIDRWECIYKECGAKCCTGGREVTAGDIRRISRATGLEPEEFAELEDEKGLFRLKGIEQCIFLNEDSSCRLHGTGAKPLFCRMYPFKFDGVIYADEIVLKVRATKNCPGLGTGQEIGDDLATSIEELGNRFVKEIKDFLRLKGEGFSNAAIIRGD
jgi:Fe-S-cluster containining protein